MTDHLAGARAALAELQQLGQSVDLAVAALANLIGVPPDPNPGKHRLAARDVKPGESWAFRDHRTQAEPANGQVLRRTAFAEHRVRRPKARRGKKAANAARAPKPDALAGDKPLGKREARRAQIRSLSMQGLSPAQIGKRLKPPITEAAVKLALRKMGGPPAAEAPGRAAAAAAAAVEALTAAQLAGVLKEIGHVVSGPDADRRWTVDRRGNLDGVALLELVNSWRRKHGQPPFKLKAE